jgi:hypothetical protein
MRNLRTGLLAVLGGLVLAVALSWVMAPHPVILGGPGTTITDLGGADPWTGEVRPMIVAVPNYGESGQVTSTRTYEVPEEWRDIRVVPLPVGFAVGSLLMLGLIALVSRRPRGTAPNPAVPTA